MAAKLKILYVAPLGEHTSALNRLWALERAGMETVRLPMDEFMDVRTMMQKVNFRLATWMGMGALVRRFNRELLRMAVEHRPDVMWGDKLVLVLPKTLERLRGMGVLTVNYSIDNPFGPRRDPGWRLYMRCIPHYDLHVVQRDQNVVDYRKRGARGVLKIQTAYEPTLHYPPPAGWSDKDRTREVSFIGTPYDDRAEFLTRLKREFGVPVVISGARWMWERKMQPDAMEEMFRGGELFGDAYREGIWSAKINLSFLTHSNQDEFAHKSFEIAGCGGFLLVERSVGHLERFVEDEEAVFFTGVEECAAKILRYWNDEPARERIAAAGRRRAEASGYHNDGQVGKILEGVRNILASKNK